MVEGRELGGRFGVGLQSARARGRVQDSDRQGGARRVFRRIGAAAGADARAQRHRHFACVFFFPVLIGIHRILLVKLTTYHNVRRISQSPTMNLSLNRIEETDVLGRVECHSVAAARGRRCDDVVVDDDNDDDDCVDRGRSSERGR